MKLEKALNFSVEDITSKTVPVYDNVLKQRALSIYDIFHQEDETEEENKPFAVSRR
jgi:hypothetical protein